MRDCSHERPARTQKARPVGDPARRAAPGPGAGMRRPSRSSRARRRRRCSQPVFRYFATKEDLLVLAEHHSLADAVTPVGALDRRAPLAASCGSRSRPRRRTGSWRAAAPVGRRAPGCEVEVWRRWWPNSARWRRKRSGPAPGARAASRRTSRRLQRPAVEPDEQRLRGRVALAADQPVVERGGDDLRTRPPPRAARARRTALRWRRPGPARPRGPAPRPAAPISSPRRRTRRTRRSAAHEPRRDRQARPHQLPEVHSRAVQPATATSARPT